MWLKIAFLIVSALIQNAMRPKPPKPKAATLEELEVPTPDEGTPQCVIFGDCWNPDWCVLGLGNFRTSGIKK